MAVPALLANPYVMNALMSFGPMLLGRMMGDPAQRYRQQIAAMYSPENIARLTQQNYQSILGSPAYSQALAQIAAGGNVASNTVAANLAARGLGTSGVGAIMSGLTPSLVGSQQSKLMTDAYSAAQQQAMDILAKRAGTYSADPSQNQRLFASGLDSYTKWLTPYLTGRYPNLFGPVKVQ